MKKILFIIIAFIFSCIVIAQVRHSKGWYKDWKYAEGMSCSIYYNENGVSDSLNILLYRNKSPWNNLDLIISGNQKLSSGKVALLGIEVTYLDSQSLLRKQTWYIPITQTRVGKSEEGVGRVPLLDERNSCYKLEKMEIKSFDY